MDDGRVSTKIAPNDLYRAQVNWTNADVIDNA